LTEAISSGWRGWLSPRANPLRSSGVWATRPAPKLDIALGQRWSAWRRGNAVRYSRVLDLGSAGGESSVWAAVARNEDDVCQLVVLKTLPEACARDGASLLRLMDEARLTARMNHPNVVRLHGVQREGTVPVIVMEYLAGQPLATLLSCANDLRKFSLELRIAIVTRLLRGLDYVHRLRDFDGRPLRVVHGGVSPDNVLVTYDGEVKLIDFSRARVRVSALDNQLARRRLPYSPPEQFSGAPDLRGDIFSVGVMLWELIANRPLWGRIPAPAIVRRLLAGDIPRLRDAVPTVDAELDRICTRALAAQPDGRYRSAGDLRGDLERYMAGRQGFVPDSAIASLVCGACREQRREAQRVIDARIGELNLSLPQAAPRLPPAARAGNVRELEIRQRKIAAYIVGAALVIAMLLWVTSRREPASPGRISGATGIELRASHARGVIEPASETGDASSGAVRLVRVDVRVRPSHAVLSIDGRRLSTNPSSAAMVWDPHLHTIRGEAEGYEKFVATFRLDSDVKIDTELRPEPSGAVRRSTMRVDELAVLRSGGELEPRRRQ
jgi:eukaryotic-like serine/threonine-protein kinase